MKNKVVIVSVLFSLVAGTANAEEVWVKSGGLQRFFFGTTLATNGKIFGVTEKTASFAVNFNEDAKYVFGFSANYGGNSFMNNTAQVMFGLGGKDHSLVIGKSATAHLCVSEVQGEFFASSSVYAPNYAFTADPLTVFPNVTVLESTLPKIGSYTYEITLETSFSGKDSVSVFIPELNKTYSYDLKLAGTRQRFFAEARFGFSSRLDFSAFCADFRNASENFNFFRPNSICVLREICG